MVVEAMEERKMLSLSTVTITAVQPVTSEYTSPAEVTVSRSGSDDSGALTVYYSLGGNASPSDYSVGGANSNASGGGCGGASSGSVTIQPNASTATLTIQSLDEPAASESVAMTLCAPSGGGYQVGGSGAATVTLQDDPSVQITPASQSTSEYTSPAEFTVSRTGTDDSQPLTAYFSLGGNANPSDYSVGSGASNGSVTIAAGAGTGSVTIPMGANSATLTIQSTDEPAASESVVLTLYASSGAGYQIGGSSTATVTLQDDVPLVQISPVAQSTSEHASPAQVTISRSESDDSLPLTVHFSLGGNANPSDYSVSSGATCYSGTAGSVTIPANASTATLTIQSLDEPAASESVALSLLAPSGGGYQVGGSSAATVTLQDDPSIVQITPAEQWTSMKTLPAEVTVSRTGWDDSQPLTVGFWMGSSANPSDYSVRDGGTCYSGTAGNVTIPAGTSTATLTIRSLDEPAASEQVVFTLFPYGSGYQVGGSNYATVTLQHDTSVVLTSSANPAVVGQPITLAALVNDGTGAVTFYDGTTCLDPGGTVELTSSVATLLLPSGLSAGSHTITAEYSGDFAPSTSPPSQILVLPTTLPAFVVNTGDTVANDPVNQASPSPLSDGSLVLSPAGAGLTYVSGADGQPTISVDNTTDYPIQPFDDGHPLQGVTAALCIGGLHATTYYSSQDLTGNLGNGTYRFAVQVPSGLATGQYAWTMTITQSYYEVGAVAPPATYSGTANVLNWNSSPYGKDWWLTGLDYLVADGAAGLTLVQSDGTMGYFSNAGSGTYTSPAGPLACMTLTEDLTQASATCGDWLLTGGGGTLEIFNSNGQLYQVVDHDGNVTQYGYNPDGTLETVVDPAGQTTTFVYHSNSATISAQGRTTTLGYNNSGQLTSITAPNPNNGETTPVTQFGYNQTSGLLNSMTDADGNVTNYAYRPDDTLETVLDAQGAALTYRAAQSQLYGTTGSGAPGSEANPAFLVIAATARAVAYDALQNPTAYTFDSFGNVTSVEDPLGNTTLYDRNSSNGNGLYNGLYTGLATEMDQPSVANGGTTAPPVTTYTYDPTTAMLSDEYDPDGAALHWDYATYATYGGNDVLPVDYIDGLGHQTAYSYAAGSGDLLSVEQYANGSSADNTGQNTTPGGDPITSYVYTPLGGGCPAGLVSSVTDPDGDVTAYVYDAAGNPTAAYQGQTCGPDTEGGTTWTFSNLAPARHEPMIYTSRPRQSAAITA